MLIDKTYYENLSQYTDQMGEMYSYSMNIDGGFAKVPVLEIIRALDGDSLSDINVSDRITRFCLQGKPVVILFNNEEVGGFTLNGMDVPWDIFDVLQKHPLALRFIMNACVADIIKKSVPPRVKEKTEAAAVVAAAVKEIKSII